MGRKYNADMPKPTSLEEIISRRLLCLEPFVLQCLAD